MRILSIGVITCNRPEGLRLLLASLARQTISEANAADFSWYVHVTDNDLSGENPKVIAALRTQFPAFDVRLSDEPVRGIPAARNRSVIETHDADALIFVDDDEEAPDGWLDAMMTMWRATSADVITGPVDAVLPEGAPVWAKASGVFEKHQSYPRGHKLSKAYTNNTLVVRKVLDHIGPTFDSSFQFTGSSDLHYFLRVVQAGFTIQWCPEARLFEHVPMSRIRGLSGEVSGAAAGRPRVCSSFIRVSPRCGWRLEMRWRGSDWAARKFS